MLASQPSSGATNPRRAWLPYLLLAVLPVVAGAFLLGVIPETAARAAPSLMTSHAVHAAPAGFGLLGVQLLVVLVAAKLAGQCMRYAGQPAVIGEMIAGILLGPSLLGWLAPAVHASIFPVDSLSNLGMLSQLGVLVFMFSAGVGFDLASMAGQRRQAIVISHAGIALPFLLGLMLAGFLFTRYAPTGVDGRSFALFIGVALSITAFPVLLRIIDERGYANRPMGRMAVASAALGDATAWAVLGVVVAIVQSQGTIPTLVKLVPATALAWLCAVPARRWLGTRQVHAARESYWMLVLVLWLLAGSLASEWLGLHALFGAFVAGLAFSANKALKHLVETRIEAFASVLLLPLFFAFTGLHTRVDLLSTSEWLLCLGIIFIASVGKLGGTWVAARACGVSNLDALRLGTLMNTRGLMELIVLGVGYDLGLINRSLFAILVIVAIATTMMTGPLLGLIDRRAARLA